MVRKLTATASRATSAAGAAGGRPGEATPTVGATTGEKASATRTATAAGMMSRGDRKGAGKARRCGTRRRCRGPARSHEGARRGRELGRRAGGHRVRDDVAPAADVRRAGLRGSSVARIIRNEDNRVVELQRVADLLPDPLPTAGGVPDSFELGRPRRATGSRTPHQGRAPRRTRWAGSTRSSSIGRRRSPGTGGSSPRARPLNSAGSRPRITIRR